MIDDQGTKKRQSDGERMEKVRERRYVRTTHRNSSVGRERKKATWENGLKGHKSKLRRIKRKGEKTSGSCQGSKGGSHLCTELHSKTFDSRRKWKSKRRRR